MADGQGDQNKDGGTTPPTDNPGDGGSGSGTGDPLANLNLSEEAKKQLESNTELLGVLTHNLNAKREANAEAKKHREAFEKLEAEKAEAEKAALKEQGEFKKLYEQEQATNQANAEKLKQVTINNKVSLLASQKGIKKASYLKMFDTTSLTVDDNLEVPGLDGLFNKFVGDNPDLFGAGTGDTPPDTDGGKPKITSDPTLNAQLQELQQAAKSGNIREIARLREFKKKHGLMKT